MADASVAYVSVLVRSREDAEMFSSSLMLAVQDEKRLEEWSCTCLSVPLDRSWLYFLIPDGGTPLESKLAGGNRYYTVGFRSGSGLLELADGLAIVSDSPLIHLHEASGPVPAFRHDTIKKLDHVLYVTRSLEASKQAMSAQTGLVPDEAHSYWYFPDFDVTDMTYALDKVFLEFNKPHSDAGFFGQVLRKSGEGLFALAFEAVDLDRTVDSLRAHGTRIGDPLPIRAVSPHTKQTEIIEQSATLSLKSTAGLRVLITNLSWL
jgi:catechol 2,3-dioxygenase-like lactoylglutathione lyase family enzyme